MRAEIARILLVEDSPSDVELTQEALAQAKIANELFVVRDGEEAMEFLEQRGAHSDAPRPDLILLDLNLPRKDGREVLKEIKENATLCAIPVVILTTSASDEDILRSYELRANSYIRKPVDLEQFTHIVQSIDEYWLGIVRLPPPGQP